MKIQKIIIIICLCSLFGANIVFANSFSMRPISLKDYKNSPIKFKYEIDAGDVIQDILSIKRKTKQRDKTTTNINLYGVDADMSSNGFLTMSSEKTEQKEFGNWIKFDETSLKIEKEAEVKYKISIPKNTTPGQYIGGIVLINSEKNNKEIQKNNNSKIKLRYATAILLEVKGEMKPTYKISDFIYSTKNGKINTHFTFYNTGNVTYSLNGETKLNGVFSSKTIKIQKRNILPGKSVDIIVGNNNQYEFLFYTKAKTTLNLSYSIGDSIKTNTIKENNNIYYLPLPILIIAIFIFIIIYIFIHKLIIKLTEKWTPYKINKFDTIFIIAEKYNMNWEKIVKKNSIKPPFILHEGEHILVIKNKDKK